MQGLKLSDAIVKMIWRHRADGKTIDGIMSAMAEEEVDVSRGSVAKYARQYDLLSEAQKEAYGPLRWDTLINDKEFSLGDIRFLLDAWAAIQAVRMPNIGEARWMVRLRHLTPNLPKHKIYALGMIFHDREVSEASGEAVDNSDLWGYVAFADHSPYDSTATDDSVRQEIYQECIRKGRFPPFWQQ